MIYLVTEYARGGEIFGEFCISTMLIGICHEIVKSDRLVRNSLKGTKLEGGKTMREGGRLS